MSRLHPIHVLTLVLAAFAVLFSFLAMSAAYEARDEAATAAAVSGFDDASGIYELQEALIRSGVIEDPSVIPDDHRRPGGPWGRCLTEAERQDLEVAAAETDAAGTEEADAGTAATAGVDPDTPAAQTDADEPDDCGTARVEALTCSDVAADTQAGGGVGLIDFDCGSFYLIDGERFAVSDRIRPDDLEASVTTVLNVEGAAEVDRVAHGTEGGRFIHVLDLDGSEDGLAPGWWYVYAED